MEPIKVKNVKHTQRSTYMQNRPGRSKVVAAAAVAPDGAPGGPAVDVEQQHTLQVG